MITNSKRDFFVCVCLRVYSFFNNGSLSMSLVSHFQVLCICLLCVARDI